MSLFQRIRADLRLLADWMLPPACLLCGGALAHSKPPLICKPCRHRLPPLPAPRCPVCALPYLTEGGEDHLCEGCTRELPPFARAIPLGLYGGGLREAIHRFKYRGEFLLSLPLGMLLAEQMEEQGVTGADLILPVPLHLRRLRDRTYNHSLLLARVLGRRWGVPVESRTLTRTLFTAPQQGLSAAERHRNLRNAFASRPLHGESVLLVDDVLTTGATASSCALTLLEAGASDVSIGVVARASRRHV